MLNPSEEIVTSWLNEQGYFVRNNLKVGQNEIDILAVHPLSGKRIHCEVSVQISPVGHVIAGSREPLAKATEHTLEERVNGFLRRKFIGKNGKVEEEVKRLLGEDYHKLFICGNLNRSENEEKEQLIRELQKYGVEVMFFHEILENLKGKVKKKGVKDNPRRFIQLMKYFSTAKDLTS